MVSPESAPRGPEQTPPPDPLLSRFIIEPGIDMPPTPDMIAPGTLEATPVVHEVTAEESQPALRGLSKWFHERRLKKASETLERMDHKNELYEHMGSTALGTTVQTENRPKPRTRVERMMDKRSAKSSFKHEVRKAKRQFVIDAFSGTASSTVNNRSRWDSAKRSAEAGARYKAGEITAEQLRQEKRKIKATPKAFPNAEQRHTKRVQTLSGANLRRKAKQPVLNRWRNGRRNRAQKRVQDSSQKLGLS